MAKHRPRVQLGSLKAMASNVRDQKSASKSVGSTELQNSRKGQKLAKDTSSSDESDDSSSDDSNDSGSGSDIEAEREKYTAKQASKRKVAQQKATSTKPTQNANANAPSLSDTQAKAKAKAKATDASSEESESDSDSASQSSDSSDGPTQNTISKEGTKSQSNSKADSTSDSESSSDSESEDEKSGAGAQQTVGAESSSDEDGDSESSESDEEANHMEVDGDENAVSRMNGDATVQGSASQVSRPSWLNNSNFVLRKASSDNPAKEVTEFFSKANLEGKQVWYFTAPASLPITVLKDMEIDLSKATTGEALLNHMGDDYGLDLESHATSTQIQLLIPSQGGDNYTSLNRGIDSTVHLRRIAKFGPGGTVSATATENYAPVPKPIREQPQGLKPRFTPIGVPSPTPVQPQSSKPDATLKRKHPEDKAGGAALTQESPSQEKSAKKSRTTKSKASSSKKDAPAQAQTPAPAASASNGTPSDKKAKKDKPKYSIQPAKQTPVPVPKILSMKH